MSAIAAPLSLRINDGIVFAAEPLIIDNADSEILNIGEPSALPTYTEDIQDELITFTKYGVSNPSGFRQTSAAPTISYPLSATFPPAALALLRAKKVTSASRDVPIFVGPILIETATLALGGTNNELQGVLADLGPGLTNDAGALVWIYDATTDVPTPGTLVASSGSPASAGEVAQGADGAFEFHPDDVGSQFYFYSPSRGANVTTLAATETVIASCTLVQKYITADNRIITFRSSNARPRPAGPIIGGTPTVNFLFVRDPSVCSLGAEIYLNDNTALFERYC